LSQFDANVASSILERASVLDTDLRVRRAAASALDGLEWNLAVAAGKDASLVSAFSVAPSRSNNIYLAADDQILVSQDAGKTWNDAGKTPSRVVTLAVSPSDPNVVYAGTESVGLCKSDDGGKTWRVIGGNLGEPRDLPVTVTALAIDPTNSDLIYVAKGTYIGTSHARLFPLGVMASQDGGRTFSALDSPATSDVITQMRVDGRTLYELAGDRVVTVAF
jgi:hypothetical protein